MGRTTVFSWLSANKEWLFQGAAVLIPIALVGGIYKIVSAWNNSGRRSEIPQQSQKSGDNSTNIQAGGDASVSIKHNGEGIGKTRPRIRGATPPISRLAAI